MTKGRYGIHGGQYIPETLMNAVIELEEAYNHYKNDKEFNDELNTLLNEYAGRPSRLYYAKRMTEDLGGAKIYLKREDLNHTGAHKINNVLGQVLLAKKMGKTRVIAETGAGQHGVATATAAALMDMECEIFMGKEDTERQALNVYRMRLLGAKVHAVTTGTATLKDAVSETMREWTKRIEDTHYVLGSCMGPHPFPQIVRDFQAVISKEIKEQLMEKEGKLPDAVLACVGGGSNAIGAFYNFIEDESVRLIGCEAAGRGINTAETAATIATGKLGIFHGMKSYFCQDEYGQIAPVYSISAGLDYPGIGPEHADLYDKGRAEYVAITDDEAVDAFEYLSRTEGIIPAIESAHAVAYARKLAPTMKKIRLLLSIFPVVEIRTVQQLHITEGRISMSKIQKAFEGKKAFIPFITCGDPDLETTEQLVYAMERAGASLIELGIPFSDPTAEGPVIQGANLRALSGGVTTDKIFDLVVKIRKNTVIPLVFMTYANVVFSYGTERFIKRAAEIGMDGLILPDVPFEEKEEFDRVCREYGLDLISLIAPTSHDRIRMIAKEASGFIYCVSSLGVTGTRSAITTDIGAMVGLVKEVTEVPCAVGFGISTPEQAAKMCESADGAIVGSAIVKICAEYGKDCVEKVEKYVKSMVGAI